MVEYTYIRVYMNGVSMRVCVYVCLRDCVCEHERVCV